MAKKSRSKRSQPGQRTLKKISKARKAPARKPNLEAKKAAASAQTKPTLPARMTPEKQVPNAVFLGLVEDYFAHVGVAAVTLSEPLALGDTIRIKGHTTDLTQRVESMHIEHQPIQAATKADAVGLRVANRVRKGDAVYKI